MIVDPTRGRRMGERVLRTFEEKGGDPAHAPSLAALHSIATDVRAAHLDDDHDPVFLHPGRSALILLLDVETTEPDLLSLALTHDSAGPALEPNATDLPEHLRALREEMPRAGSDSLAEELLLLEDGPRLAALAERLDHLRHLHLLPVDAETRDVWREAKEIWHPVAERSHPVLARRFGWWTRKFERRYGAD